VITEALDVKDYVAVRRFHTANRMRITKKGIVYAAVRADELEIEGVLEGSALALDTIRLGRKAKVKGDLRASRLEVAKGATLVGHVEIGPSAVPELENLVGAPAEPRDRDALREGA
jgi:cytoskeletal protein CcmA (bactofilin family)